MPADVEMGLDELRQLRPSRFLHGPGAVDAAGEIRVNLAGNFATAACVALEDGDASSQELLTVYEALKQCLQLPADGGPQTRLRQAVEEAFDVTSGVLGKEVHAAIASWVEEWIPFVKTDNGIAAFMQHLRGVAQQYALIMSLKHRTA